MNFICLIFLKKEMGKFIGEAGLIYLAFDKKNKDIEVGYTLNEKYWEKGYATELAEFFIKWGFDNFYFNKIISCCEPNNISSRNFEKNAM
jgi:[ribosomal protein S5]-alanine N-acetyltransferase